MAATKEPTPFELVTGIRKKIRKLEGEIALQADKLKGMKADLKTQQTLLSNTIDQEGQVNLFSETVAAGSATVKAEAKETEPAKPKKVTAAKLKERLAPLDHGLTQKDVDHLFAAGVETLGDLVKARDGATLSQVQGFTKAMGERAEKHLLAVLSAPATPEG